MDEKINCWHLDTLGTHNEFLYSELIREEDIVSENLKELEEYSYSGGYLRGYYARKGKVKYFIDEKTYDHLPIKIGSETDEMVIKEDVVTRPLKPIPFKIMASKTMEVRSLVDNFIPFSHTNPTHWTLMKIVALMSFIGKTFVCVSSQSHFGKSSAFDCLNGISNKTPVFKPRSIPGTLHYMNSNGCLVFDEVQGCKKEVKDIIEHISLELGGGKTIYHNGALRSVHTKQSYNCILQSIAFLYNNVGNYANPSKDYFEFLFRNNKAIDNRFLKMKFEGVLNQEFLKDFDVVKASKDNRMFYITFAKDLLYLQELKRSNGLESRWVVKVDSMLVGRKKQIFSDLLWLLDAYCVSQVEFDVLVGELISCIRAYELMVSNISAASVVVDEEVIGE